MAKPGELAELIARLLKLEEATVRQQARELRNHGLMSKEKGGRGAGSMTARDAAHLLVAAAVRPPVKNSADAVRQFHACIASNDNGDTAKWDLSYLPASEIQHLHSEHSIVDLIEATTSAFCDGQWADKVSLFSDTPFDAGKFILSISLGGPEISATASIIQLTERGKSRSEKVAGEMHLYGDTESVRTYYSYSFHFGHKVLIEIGKLLRA